MRNVSAVFSRLSVCGVCPSPTLEMGNSSLWCLDRTSQGLGKVVRLLRKELLKMGLLGFCALQEMLCCDALLCTPVCIPVRMLARWFWCASMPKRGLRCYNGCPSQPLLFREQQTWWEIHSRERILCSSVWVNAVTHIALIWACHNRLLSLLLRHSVVVAPRQTPTWVRHPMCCFVNGWCSSILCWPTVGWKGLSGVGRYIPPEILSSNLVFPNLSFNLDRDICAVFISWDIIIIIGILLLYLHLFVKPFHFSRWEHVQWLPYLSVKVSLRVFQSTCALLFGMRTL